MWLGDGRYVAAVVNAGGMGFITALAFPDAEEFRRQIHLCREATRGKPFGVNISVPRRPGFKERVAQHIDIAIEEGVRFVETSGSSPDWFIDRLKTAGCVVIHKVPGIKYVASAERSGVDAISLIGAEAGGHPGVLMIGTMVQGAQLRNETSLPCVIGGGIGTGRQLVAALALGVDGVLMGSRMLACTEMWSHARYKERVIEGDGTDSRVCMTSFRNNHRVLDNETSRAVAELEAHGVADIEQYQAHVNGRLARSAYETGDYSRGMLDYGQASVFVERVETVEQIFDAIIDDATQSLATVKGSVVSR
jgi:NAD(P)H-dependent flavin oxidoreductase YrpB (nitropropane dioxygenase family)